MKRILSIALCLMLVVSMFACTTSTAQTATTAEPQAEATQSEATANEPTNLTGITVLFSTDLPWPTETVKKLEEEANVSIDWTVVTLDEWFTKKGILMASDDLPDIFFGVYMTDTEANSGVFTDLAPLIDQTTNVKQFFNEVSDAKKMSTNTDGTVYALPSKVALRPASKETLFVAKDWCEQNNIAIPTTTDEFEEYLKAFVAGDANSNGVADEFGISFAGVATGSSLCQQLIGSDSLCVFFPSFGVVMNDESLCMVKDGVVTFSPTMDGFKECCKWLNKLYSEGLIDPNSFTNGYAEQAAKYRTEGGITGAAGNGWTISNVVGDYADQYTRIAPLIGPNGDQYWQSNQYQYKYTPNTCAISSTCADPSAAMRFLDLCYDNYTNFMLSYGEDGVCVSHDADGNPTFLTVPDGMTDIEFHLFNGALDAVAPGWVSDEFEASITGESDMRNVYESDKFYEPYFLTTSERFPYVRWDKATQDELATLQTDIDGYVNQMVSDFVMNGDVDERWEDYLSQLEKMGLPRLMEIYTAAYQASLN